MRKLPVILMPLFLLALLSASVASPSRAGAPAIQSDDFSSATLGPVWTFDNPLGDAAAGLSGTGTSDAWLNLTVPGGASHDAFNGNNAPRLTQAVTDADFQIEVRVESPVSGAFQFQGLYIEQDADHWMRIDINSNAGAHRALALTVSAGAPTIRHNPTIATGPSPVPFWLRLTRAGDQWTHEYSPDGSAWTPAGPTFTHAMTVTRLGLLAGNAGGTGSPALTARFDYFFETGSAIDPEDPVTCGNDMLDPGEECDDGNTIDGDGCQATCMLPACGDGILDAGEACDDGNPDSGDGCSATCTTIVSDDFSGSSLGAFWEFVDPLSDSTATLSGHGTADAWVNLTVAPGIAHDAFNGNNAPRLIQPVDDADFQIEVRIENPLSGAFQFQGIYVEQDLDNWMRIDINSNATHHRALAATITDGAPTIRHNSTIAMGPSTTPLWLRLTRSGDTWTQAVSTNGQTYSTVGSPFNHVLVVNKLGLLAGNAGANDGFTASFDYLFETASPITPEDATGGVCGDGMLDSGEECDDGNTQDGDGCQGDCRNPVCGDGIVDTAEDCDDGGGNSDSVPDACRSDCSFAGCGDGVVDTDESCDDADQDDGDGCSAVCQLETPCGDGVQDDGEECDDGNNIDGDGCSASCRGVVSDDFSAPALRGHWQFENPQGDASLTLSGAGTSDAFVNIAVPAGTPHDAFNGNDAPRLMQDADNADFTIQTRIENSLSGSNTFQGFLVRQDADNWLRADIVSSGGGYRTFVARIVNGVPTILHNQALADGPSPAPLELVLSRNGNSWTFDASLPGGDKGAAGASFTHPMTVRSVGLMAGNAVDNPGFSAQFDYFFEAGSPVVPEDPIACGDGNLDPGEACDDGNNVDGDGCSATCTLEPACGDGTLDPGESCDDGNNVDGDGCSATCTLEPACGDGTLDPGEACDDGNNVDGDGCSATCTLEPACGDGNLDPGEACDDGNNVDGDGCSATCTLEPACGDGTLDAGEACDDGNNVDGDGCSATCTLEPACGDGTLDAGEACDDGNNVDGDGCSATCTLEPACGDGTLDPGEACDDGNNVDGDGCSATCTLEPACGDGTLDPGESCDDGNNVDGDGCSATCTLEPACGDGNLDPGEACDDGNNDDGDGCSATCTLEPACGDGTLDPGESCDDGNNDDGDGCSATCTLEPACGDGTLDPGESCDDGNNDDGDGCSATCTLEPACGDGTLDPGEACDDGNNVDGDGCSATCTLEPACGDGVVDSGEECDDGNDVNDDACSNDCTLCQDQDPCDGLDNDCDGVVDQDCDGLRMEAGRVTVGGTHVTVSLTNTYASPVVVATVQYVNNTVPVVARISGVTADSFDIRLQNPSGRPVALERVSYWVVEEGVWNVDGVRLEAHTFVSTVTSGRDMWAAEDRAYGQAYDFPVVLGQVMSENDPRWSAFFAQGEARSLAPSSTTLRVGKMVGEDPDRQRAPETLAYIVVEAARTILAGIAFDARVGEDSVAGAINGAPFPYTFTSPFGTDPTIGLATSAGLDGGDGCWAQIFGSRLASPSRLFLSVDEDQVGDDERSHTTESVAYAVFAAPMVYPAAPMCALEADCDDGIFCNGVETCGPDRVCRAGDSPCPDQGCDEREGTCFDPDLARLESRTISNVAGTPVTTFTQNAYTSPVIACTAVYDRNRGPVVVRVKDVTSRSFAVFLQTPGGGAPPAAETIHCLVAEEGTWQIDGHPVEARRYTSTQTARELAWATDAQVLAHPFARPVVLGQVMSANDARWSTYVQHGPLITSPPTETALRTGKHVGQDPDRTRNDEAIGFIVFEEGHGTIGGVPFLAALGPDTVRGIDNGPPFDYAFSVPFATAPVFVVATQAGMDGGDGSWAYLYGTGFATRTHLALAVDEDQLRDLERSHTHEQVAFLALENHVVMPQVACATDEDCADGLFCNGRETCNTDTGMCEMGPPVECNDGVGCTSDVCDETAAACVAAPDDAACNNGLFCDGIETCDALLDCQAGTPPCGPPTERGNVCDEAQDTCPLDEPTARMEWGLLEDVGGDGRIVHLTHTYNDPIVVASVRYDRNTIPVVTRIRNIVARGSGGSHFEVFLQNPSGGSVMPDDVNYLVVEKGTWVIDGVAVEAQKYTSMTTAHASNWRRFDVQSYGQAYTQPVVLGQVMTVNDPRFSTFWSRGETRFVAPTAASLRTGKMAGEDPDPQRAPETVGFIVLEAGHGLLGGVEFEARVGSDSVQGVVNAPPYSYAFDTAFPARPEVAVVTQAGMDGFNGGWMYTYGPAQASPTQLHLAADEDQLFDPERSRTTEQASYCVFQSSGAVP